MRDRKENIMEFIADVLKDIALFFSGNGAVCYTPRSLMDEIECPEEML